MKIKFNLILQVVTDPREIVDETFTPAERFEQFNHSQVRSLNNSAAESSDVRQQSHSHNSNSNPNTARPRPSRIPQPMYNILTYRCCIYTQQSIYIYIYIYLRYNFSRGYIKK